jgi:glycine cleavage system H lipoate-binding protein
LRKHPEAVNADPYGAGWMIKIKVSNMDYESLSRGLQRIDWCLNYFFVSAIDRNRF